MENLEEKCSRCGFVDDTGSGLCAACWHEDFPSEIDDFDYPEDYSEFATVDIEPVDLTAGMESF